MEPETWQAPAGDVIPNHPSFTVLLYRGTGLEDPDAARERFRSNGWGEPPAQRRTAAARQACS